MRQKDLIIKHVFALLKGLTYILASKCELENCHVQIEIK